MKSWKTEVCTQHNGEDTWASNALRFATEAEAKHAGNELLSRWWVPTAHRAVESEDPVNYVFNLKTYRPEPIES